MMADPRGFEDILASLERQYLPLDGNPENALLKCVASALTARLDILRTLLDTSSMGIVLTDLEGRIAFANAGVPLSLNELGGSVSLAVFIGFILGKPIGALTFSWLAVRWHIAIRPPDLSWRFLTGGRQPARRNRLHDGSVYCEPGFQ